MTDVVLLYDADCPNAEAARLNLGEAFARTGIPPRWQERLASDADVPDSWRGFGSPTILVDGIDVAGEQPTEGRSCRIYQDEAGRRAGAPSVEVIASRLSGIGRQQPPTTRHRVQAGRLAGMVPAVGLGLLPVGLCPACWPVYAGLVGALGLGFLMEARYLLPITGLGLGLALFALAFRARQRRGFGPMAVGLVASVLVLVGKFTLGSDPVLYTGLATLVAASLWNAWPLPKTSVATPGCPGCAAATPET